ncbi:MAG: hypothetical protein A2017_13650 [Lentisphaerae bacterium GWF2_44_16]|nr:MAG: hypothetical protein A2017_13650 [Lentisphaerae bacterium GWF2_44_16]
MKKNKLTVAQIGCGAFAEAQDFPNLTKNPKISLKWCCDISKDRAKEMAKKFNVPEVTTDFNAPINDPEVDMIKISTSHEVHLPIIEAAARNGKHIFCEKPMALEEDEAFKIISAVRKGKVKLCVDLNRRMAPSMHSLKANWLKHRANPRHQSWRYVEVERELFPEEKQAQFLVRVQDESYSYRLVHLDPMKGGGLVFGETVHWLDLACWLYAPQYPVEIQASGSARFSHCINLKFSGGDTTTILFSCGGTFDYPKELYEISSSGALFRNNFFVENEYYGVPGLDRELFPMQHDPLKNVGKEGGFSAYMKKYAERAQKTKGNIKNAAPFSVDKGHENMLNTFVEAILKDKPSPCDEMAGFMSTYLAKLAIKSIELRQALPVPLDKVVPCIP